MTNLEYDFDWLGTAQRRPQSQCSNSPGDCTLVFQVQTDSEDSPKLRSWPSSELDSPGFGERSRCCTVCWLRSRGRSLAEWRTSIAQSERGAGVGEIGRGPSAVGPGLPSMISIQYRTYRLCSSNLKYSLL